MRVIQLYKSLYGPICLLYLSVETSFSERHYFTTENSTLDDYNYPRNISKSATLAGKAAQLTTFESLTHLGYWVSYRI